MNARLRLQMVWQGNSEEELPEVVLGCARVSRVDFGKVRPFPAHVDPTASEAGRMLPLRHSGQGLDGPLQSAEKVVVANAL
jgi:hypothetical protein